MTSSQHIPEVRTIADFFRLLRFGSPTGDDISVTRIEDQPQNKWTEVPLFRNDIYRIIFLIDSKVEWNFPSNNITSTKSKNCIYFAHPGKLESWKASPDNRGYAICFEEEFCQEYTHGQSLDQYFPFFNFESRPILYLTQEESDSLVPILENMIEEAESVNRDRKDMLKHLLFQYLILINRIYKQCENELSREYKNNTSIYNRFKRELDKHFADLAVGNESIQASVSTLAERMALTPGYLGTVIKELTGKTAVAHINEKSVVEAKSYLLYTELQMSQIARLLGFNNSSYFTRFFKKNTGVTPKGYRQARLDEMTSH